MKIAVLSGKGGAGKTFVSVNLAAIAGGATYVDCDVEEPNGRLFLRPQSVRSETVYKRLPDFAADKCIACRKCVAFCRFNALAFLRGRPKLFPEVCHCCGGCALVCPAGAVAETRQEIGVVEEGVCGAVRVITGVMKPGEASGVPVIRSALQRALREERLLVIDCPPGSACAVMESVREADYCLLVAEPTAFGLHNLAMVAELVRLLGKPCGVVVNKAEAAYEPLDAFCGAQQQRVLARIPYSAALASLGAAGKVAAACSSEAAALFGALLAAVREEALA